MLKLVIPKGSLEEQTLRLFEAADLHVRRGSGRDYHGTIDDDRIERVSVLRPQEIPIYVQDGLFDLGITGQDWIAESDSDVEVLATLSYAKTGTGHGTKVVLAVPNEHPAEQRLPDAAGLAHLHRVRQPHRAALRELGIPVKVRWSYGATEAKVPEIVDAIVDVTETGSTLRAHGMKIIETLLTSEPVLVANREAAADPVKRAAMDDITTLLLGALQAEGRVLIKLNVSDEARDAVLAVVPSMKAPTVSPLADGGYAIETVVDKRGVNRLHPGAEGGGSHRHPRAPDLQDRALTRSPRRLLTVPLQRTYPPGGSLHGGWIGEDHASIAAVAACLIVGTLLTTPAGAKPGRLDRFFSGDGRQTAFNNGGTGYGVAIDGQQRIVVVGYTLGANTNLAVARFLPNGRFDPNFSGDGRVMTTLGGSDYGFDVAIHPDGGIIVAGERVLNRSSRAAVVRYGPRGRLNRDFGGGDGIVLTSFGKRLQGANAVAVGASGNIVIGGYVSNGVTSRWALARYGPRGQLDGSFGGDGKVTTDISPAGEQINDLVIVPGGKVVAVGYAEAGLTPRFAIARYNRNGRPDRGFGRRRGVNIVDVARGSDIAHGLALGPGGKLLAVGTTANGGRPSWGIVRFGPRGRLDMSFSANGKAVVRVGPRAADAYGAAILPNGKSLVVGRAIRSGRGTDFVVARLKENGAFDRTFGRRGRSFADFFDGNDGAREVAIQANGKIVVAGIATDRRVPRMAVARFLNA